MYQISPLRSAEDLNRCLTRLSEDDVGIPVKRINDRHWQLGMSNDVGAYTLDIKDQDPWISYGTQLTPPLEGENRGDFYESMLEENARLNGAKIGIENDRVVLVHEEPKYGASEATIYRNVATFNEAQKHVYPKVLRKAEELGLRFRRDE
jgi:hypothetical protein